MNLKTVFNNVPKDVYLDIVDRYKKKLPNKTHALYWYMYINTMRLNDSKKYADWNYQDRVQSNEYFETYGSASGRLCGKQSFENRIKVATNEVLEDIHYMFDGSYIDYGEFVEW